MDLPSNDIELMEGKTKKKNFIRRRSAFDVSMAISDAINEEEESKRGGSPQ